MIIFPETMAGQISCENAHPQAKAKRVPGERARSVPHKQPFVRAVFLSALHYMGILAALTTLAVFFVNPTGLATKVFVACLVFIGITWLLAYFRRRSTHCPLCKGTPLVNTGALAHQKATKIWPFNHGVSATLSIIATQTFRCMYCGTAFDLMKTPSHLTGKYDANYRTDYTTYTPDEPS
jgi:hypothetical protein